ncbi:MAG: transketolase [Candidatus Woykebacteria bacterium RBG_13_40_7b]|uniref:Transketolase n=1 Tax=Candidatus Woykebacteria bacterium RBG_13_40_7b TaxID=1802594 RepID=A0A1G1W7C7_9BACT|nr:MAG: transketolase [Candidatus Woykebacteria bacterium RBG_13_40_7b]
MAGRANTTRLEELEKLVRYYILRSTTKAGSGHPTSSLSAIELMVALFFHKLRFDLKNPNNPNNDRVIFSKGHASPLLYSLYAAAGVISEKELDKLRKFGSPLEGHPTPRFKYVEVATGSLGQGLSVGFGMALNAKYLDKLPYKTYVLLGDSEIAEGSVWEAIQLAAYYKLNNLIGIMDVNRLGQSQETMLGYNVNTYKDRLESFGWEVIKIDGHNMEQIIKAFDLTDKVKDKPTMIVAKTLKGRGVSFLENKEGWHGKALGEDDYKKALQELGQINTKIKGIIKKPTNRLPVSKLAKGKIELIKYDKGEKVATRRAYGNALKRLGGANPNIVSLDAETKNSTYAEIFKEAYPGRFFEMFIAEQNMVGAALGLSKRGKIPFASTFAAFLTRAYDQIRMASYSRPNIKIVGSHAGVSIGEDGPSQMGLEDLAMFRSLAESIVLYPADAVSTEKLVEEAANKKGLFYIRTTRSATPIIYGSKEKFPIGGSKVVVSSNKDVATVVAAGITLHEALKAANELAKKGIQIRVIDAYSIKPIDEATLKKAVSETNNTVITVEDHRIEGGLGDAVLSVFAETPAKVYKLAVTKIPRSGTPNELLDFEGISTRAIAAKVLEVAKTFS